jgi:orotidine-5'-phosphate decarboxylase
MLRAAVRGAAEKSNELKIVRPFIVGVTVLTSETNTKAIQEKVLQAAAMAKEAGLDGVVCSVLEAPMIRKEFGDKFIIVTPGIRPAGSKADDQRRTATAGEAIKAGSDFLVVGRPILESKDPLQAVKDLV